MKTKKATAVFAGNDPSGMAKSAMGGGCLSSKVGGRLLATAALCLLALLAVPQPAEAATVGDLTIVKTADGSDPIEGVDYEARDYDYDGDLDTLAIISSTRMTVSGTTTRMLLTTGEGIDANLTIENLSVVTPGSFMEPALDVGDSWADGSGSLTLTVRGDNLLQSQQAQGICVPFFTSLTITKESTGRLEVVGAPGPGGAMPGSPAIGDTGVENGPITIDGGTVVAHGGPGSAGIGGGYRTSGQNITINGGEVTADSAGSGAGIGGGGVYSFARNIAINGGIVRATGGMMGAGIGSGAIGGAENITIAGGEVWAYGGATGGAGIGGGRYGYAEGIVITGGFVHAEGADDASYGEASGIGSGSMAYQSNDNKVEPLAGFSGRLDGVLGGGDAVVTAPQSYTFENAGKVAEVSFAATPSIDAADLPQGQVGSPYQSTLAGAGGVSPYTWSVTAGALPAGLALDASTGELSGTPTREGDAAFTVTLTDAWGVTAAMQKRLEVKAAPVPVPASVNVTPQGTVALSGRDVKAGEFSFTVKDAAGTVVGTGANVAARDGQASAIGFSKMTFDKPGTYVYVVSQEPGTLDKVTYDKATFQMVVAVVESGGKLTANVSYPRGEPAFKNVYAAPGPKPKPDPEPDPEQGAKPTPDAAEPKPLVSTGDGTGSAAAPLAGLVLVAGAALVLARCKTQG